MSYSVKQDWNQVLDLLGLLTAFSPLIFLLPGRAKLRGRLRAASWCYIWNGLGQCSPEASVFLSLSPWVGVLFDHQVLSWNPEAGKLHSGFPLTLPKI